jgi:hypothetical protein
VVARHCILETAVAVLHVDPCACCNHASCHLLFRLFVYELHLEGKVELAMVALHRIEDCTLRDSTATICIVDGLDTIFNSFLVVFCY